MIALEKPPSEIELTERWSDMNWEIASEIASVVESFFVAVSVVLIVLQLRKQTELAQAANSQAAFELSSPFNIELIRDREFARLWMQGPDLSDPLDKFRHESLVIWWLLLHENIFYQWKKGLLEEEAFLPWRRDLCAFAERVNLSADWPQLRPVYQTGFATYVEGLLLSTSRADRRGPEPVTPPAA